MTPWMSIRVNLPGHRKVIQLRHLLELDERQTALGIVVDLFAQTFLNEWRTGDWSKWGTVGLEEKLGWKGETGKLVKALQSVGILDGLRVHDWEKEQHRALYDRKRFRGPEDETPAQRSRRIIESRK
jgi:hypothetical protein